MIRDVSFRRKRGMKQSQELPNASTVIQVVTEWIVNPVSLDSVYKPSNFRLFRFGVQHFCAHSTCRCTVRKAYSHSPPVHMLRVRLLLFAAWFSTLLVFPSYTYHKPTKHGAHTCVVKCLASVTVACSLGRLSVIVACRPLKDVQE